MVAIKFSNQTSQIPDANFSGANLSSAELEGADFSYADLSGADLSGADLTNIKYNDETIWPESFELSVSR